MKGNWVTYKNGNYNVHLNLNNGTKIRENKLDFFAPETAESIDLKITNSCDMGCVFCHEKSVPNGKHADLMSPSFLDKIHPYMEIAIGGGNPLEHPDLFSFLKKLQELKAVPSMTVNQVHFEKNFDFIKSLVDDKLIYGLGISLVNPTPDLISKVQTIPNAVLHIIAGIISEEQLKLISGSGLKVLILGYKQVGRGVTLYEHQSRDIQAQIDMLAAKLPELIKTKAFRTISFDNLSLGQLRVKDTMSEEEWNHFYMGDDGIDGDYSSGTFFVDLVERKFAINSCSSERWPIMETLEDMFHYLQGIYQRK